MPKPTKPKTHSDKLKEFYSAQPWQCHNSKDHSEITAYVEASGTWQVVAIIQPTAGASTGAIAQFICGLVNDYQKNKDLLREAMKALESVLNEGLNYSTEQDADEVVDSIKKRIS